MNPPKLRALFLGLLLLAPFVTLNAASVAVPNFSFESPVQAPGANNTGGNGNTTAITSWTITAPASSGTNNGVFYPAGGFTTTGPLPAPADSNQVAYVFPGAAGATCTITTSSSLGAIAANTLYTLTVALGNWSIQSFDTGTYTIQLLANGVPVATNTLAGSAITHGTFSDLSASFTSPALGGVDGQALTISLSATAGASGNDEGFFDNVRLTATSVPEPATAILLVAGAGVLLGTRRLRR